MKISSLNQLHHIKRIFQRFAIKAIRSFNPLKNQKYSEYEREAISICNKLILKKDTTLLISPISGKRYIKSDDSQLFIIIDDHQITIVNHTYSYTITLTPRGYTRVSKIFDNNVELRRIQMEVEITSNVKHSLSNIYKNIVNEKI